MPQSVMWRNGPGQLLGAPGQAPAFLKIMAHFLFIKTGLQRWAACLPLTWTLAAATSEERKVSPWNWGCCVAFLA